VELENVTVSEDKMTLKNLVENKIIKYFTPASVLVNNKQEIIYLKGKTAPYLEPVEGIANMNVIEIAKPDIRIKLSGALGKAIRDNKKVVEEKLHIKTGNTYKFINIHVLPIERKNDETSLFLVVFEDVTEKEMVLHEEKNTFSDKDKDYIDALALELKHSKDHLQSVIEQSEKANEEIKATNEALQSANEELQSTNEELETSQEELRSINEELHTVNAEYQNKIIQLSDLNNDISNLLTNTEIATIFLDLELKIKKFTPRVTDFIKLLERDINRSIENFSTKLDYPEFQKDIEKVVNTLVTVEKEIDSPKKSYICRMMPYRTLENVVTGVVITFVDVTNLKYAQITLRDYKNLLEKNSSIAKLGVWDFNLKTKEVIWSNETYKIHEVSRDFNPSKDSAIEFYHPDYQKLLSQLLEKAITKGEGYNVDLRLTTNKGNDIWVRTIGEAVIENDEVVKLSGTIQDINEQKLSTEALKESENKYRAIFDNSLAAIMIADDKGKYLSVNKAASELFGYSQDEFLHMKAGNLQTSIGTNSEERYLKHFKKGSETGEFKFVTKSKIVKICQYQAVRLKPDFNISILTDITELKINEQRLIESEKKFRDIVQDMRVGVILQGQKAEILQSNKVARELLGLTEDQLLDKTSYDQDWNVIHEDGSPFPGDTHPVPVAIAASLPVLGVIMGVYRPKLKDRVWLLVDAIPQINSDGMVEKVVVTFIDITARKKSEELLLKSEVNLKKLNATKDKFFSIIAHDLKSPFNTIIGLSEILNEEATNYSTEELQEFAGLIHQSSTLAYKLLNNLLEWSRLQTGTIKPSFVKIKPSDVINEVKLFEEPIANSKGIQLQSEINADDYIWADLDMVKTILRNLISNALKFTNPKGTVKIETQIKGDDMLFIVSDTGVGIKSEHLGNLFKIDNKLSRIGTAKEKGTGLGLILCAEFVILQGGKIWVESQSEVGSKFYFTIPKK